jgi:hypothetical protein
VAGLAEPAPLRRRQRPAGRRHPGLPRPMTRNRRSPPGAAGESHMVRPSRLRQRRTSTWPYTPARSNGSWKANPRAAWASGRSTRCMLPGPGGAVGGQRRPSGEHRRRRAVHERPVGLGQLLQQRLGPRPATAVAEVLHGQPGYLPRLPRRPQPPPRPRRPPRQAAQRGAAVPGAHPPLIGGVFRGRVAPL